MARLVFAAAGEEFEDDRIEDMSEWLSLKPSKLKKRLLWSAGIYTTARKYLTDTNSVGRETTVSSLADSSSHWPRCPK